MSTQEHHRSLTRNQALVYEALRHARSPLSAYTILDRLRGHGLRAPLQVYRALGKLISLDLVHRLESLNAFIACRDAGCESHQSPAFAVCDRCGQVTEFADPKIERRLRGWARENGFSLADSTIELRGSCRSCLTPRSTDLQHGEG